MLVDLQVKGGSISDKEEYKKGIIAREELGSTAVGEGIAIPHAKNKGVKAPSLSAMTVPNGVDYEALDDEPQVTAVGDSEGKIKVLAVTACPTGIAHTYMVAEALEKAGNKLGVPIKVETNGSGGAKKCAYQGRN